MQRGKVDVVLFGADRVAENGDVANKVGTYKVRCRRSPRSLPLAQFSLCRCGAQMCVVARENGVPTYACVPTSTIDLTIPDGLAIPIEERSATEVTTIDGELAAPCASRHTLPSLVCLRVCRVGAGAVVAPAGVPVYNPAFDVTPHKYITGKSRASPITSLATHHVHHTSLVPDRTLPNPPCRHLCVCVWCVQASSQRRVSAIRHMPSPCERQRRRRRHESLLVVSRT